MERGRQLQEFFGYPYPTVVGYAELYSICAQEGNRRVMFLQNHSVDPLFDFDISLPKACKSFRLYGGEGKLRGDRIHITSTLAPQGTLLLETKTFE